MIDRPGFWLCMSLALAGMTIWLVRAGEFMWPLMLLNTMLASANLGAKCVRAEILEDQETRQ